ncbi:hypothetical protein HK405_012071, partial [Cladochytrium tenue]
MAPAPASSPPQRLASATAAACVARIALHAAATDVLELALCCRAFWAALLHPADGTSPLAAVPRRLIARALHELRLAARYAPTSAADADDDALGHSEFAQQAGPGVGGAQSGTDDDFDLGSPEIDPAGFDTLVGVPGDWRDNPSHPVHRVRLALLENLESGYLPYLRARLTEIQSRDENPGSGSDLNEEGVAEAVARRSALVAAAVPVSIVTSSQRLFLASVKHFQIGPGGAAMLEESGHGREGLGDDWSWSLLVRVDSSCEEAGRVYTFVRSSLGPPAPRNSWDGAYRWPLFVASPGRRAADRPADAIDVSVASTVWEAPPGSTLEVLDQLCGFTASSSPESPDSIVIQALKALSEAYPYPARLVLLPYLRYGENGDRASRVGGVRDTLDDELRAHAARDLVLQFARHGNDAHWRLGMFWHQRVVLPLAQTALRAEARRWLYELSTVDPPYQAWEAQREDMEEDEHRLAGTEALDRANWAATVGRAENGYNPVRVRDHRIFPMREPAQDDESASMRDGSDFEDLGTSDDSSETGSDQDMDEDTNDEEQGGSAAAMATPGPFQAMAEVEEPGSETTTAASVAHAVWPALAFSARSGAWASARFEFWSRNRADDVQFTRATDAWFEAHEWAAACALTASAD